MRSFRGILDFNPEARFFSLFTCDGASKMEQELCSERNKRIMQAIKEDDLDNYLSTYPLDYSMVEYVQNRKFNPIMLHGLKAIP